MKKTIILICVIFSVNLFSQTEGDFYNIVDYQDVDISAISNGTFKSISVKISNFTNEALKVNFPEGGVFINKSDSEQNLIVLFYDYLSLNPNSSSEIIIGTACANPKRKVPSNGRTNWTYTFDKKVGELISFYHSNRSMVELVTGSEYHDTQNKRHNFLQMCVWVYYKADKEQILNFATKYIFDNDKQSAKEFVDLFYPLALTFINVYKSM